MARVRYVMWIRSFDCLRLARRMESSVWFPETEYNFLVNMKLHSMSKAYVEENVGWARHELPEGGGEVYVWLGAMIIDHGTDFFR